MVRGLAIAGSVCVAALCVIALVAWLLTRGSDLPYTAHQMRSAQGDCSTEHSVFGTNELKCLRDALPELSDDQLNRLDHLIEQASK